MKVLEKIISIFKTTQSKKKNKRVNIEIEEYKNIIQKFYQDHRICPYCEQALKLACSVSLLIENFKTNYLMFSNDCLIFTHYYSSLPFDRISIDNFVKLLLKDKINLSHSLSAICSQEENHYYRVNYQGNDNYNKSLWFNNMDLVVWYKKREIVLGSLIFNDEEGYVIKEIDPIQTFKTTDFKKLIKQCQKFSLL